MDIVGTKRFGNITTDIIKGPEGFELYLDSTPFWESNEHYYRGEVIRHKIDNFDSLFIAETDNPTDAPGKCLGWSVYYA